MTKTHGFCERPGHLCDMNYCDENGCQERVRYTNERGVPGLDDANLLRYVSYQVKDSDAYNQGVAELASRGLTPDSVLPPDVTAVGC